MVVKHFKKKSAFLIFLALKPNGNTHVTFVGFDFKAAAKFTLEIFNVMSTIFSFFPPCPLQTFYCKLSAYSVIFLVGYFIYKLNSLYTLIC